MKDKQNKQKSLCPLCRKTLCDESSSCPSVFLSIALAPSSSPILAYGCEYAHICVLVGLHTYRQAYIQTCSHTFLPSDIKLFLVSFNALFSLSFLKRGSFPPLEHFFETSPAFMIHVKSFSCACLMRNDTQNESLMPSNYPLHMILLYHK